MSAIKFNLEVSLAPVACAWCGITIWLESDLLQRRRTDGKEFFCPSGHSNFFRDTEVMRLKREIEAEKRRTEMALRDGAEIAAERRKAEARAKRAEGKLKRVHAGVCPECKRNFGNLARHMETRHRTAVSEAGGGR